MEKLMEILEDLRPDVDFETETLLIDGGVLTSFDIISLVATLSEEFDIEISPKWMKNANFNSAEKMWAMIQAIQEDE